MKAKKKDTLKTYVVAHPKLYLKVENDGKAKMTRLDVGTEYECLESQAKNLVKRGKLVIGVEAKKVKAANPKKDNEDVEDQEELEASK